MDNVSQTSVSPGESKTFKPVEWQPSDNGRWDPDSGSKAPRGGFLACVTWGVVSHPPLIIKKAGRPPPINHHYHLTPPVSRCSPQP